MTTAQRALALSLVALTASAAVAVADPLPGQEQERSTTTVRQSVTRLVADLEAGDVTVRVGRSTKVEVLSTWTVREPETAVTVRDGVLTVSGRCGPVPTGFVVIGGVRSGCTTDVVVTLASKVVRGLISTTGAVVVTGTHGDLDVSAGWGPATLSQLRAPVLSVDTNGGRVSLTDISGRQATVNAGSGAVTASRLSLNGDLSVDTNGGAVTVQDARVRVLESSSGSGALTLRRVRATKQAVVDTNGGAVRVEASQVPALRTNSGSGRVVVAASRVDSLTTDTNGGAIDVTGTPLVRAQLSSGSGPVRVETSVAPTALVVDTNGGRVELTVPAGSYRVVTDTNGGTVRLDRITPDAAAPRSLEVSSGSGDITLTGR